MTLARKVYDMRSEIKSPEDVAEACVWLQKVLSNYRRTYDFIITSDMPADSGEIR